MSRPHRMLFALVAWSVAGGAACVVKTSGPVGVGPGPGAPPPPPASGPVAGPAPTACPQELGADAPETPDGALALGVGSHQGCYGLDDRRDVFVLTAPAHPGPVLYRLRITTQDGHPCIETKDADRARMHQLAACSAGRGAALDAWAIVMGGTTWYLETRDGLGDWYKTARPYTLDVQAFPLPDGAEPDSQQAPVPLALDVPMQAYLVDAANAKGLHHDYYAVEVPKTMRRKTRFAIEITDVAADAIAVVEVLDADGRRLGGGGSANPGANVRTEVKLKGPGTYVFHVRNGRGDAHRVAGKDEPMVRATKPYTIKVSVD